MEKFEHPIQPIVMEKKTIRFKENKIILYLFCKGDMDLNEIESISDIFTIEDKAQLYMLLGYSISGFQSQGFYEDLPQETKDKIEKF